MSSSVASYMQANTTHDPDPRFESVHFGNVSSTYGANKDGKKFRLKISQRLHWTGIIAFISYLVLITSFASPYWLSSYSFTDSAFKRLGLWDFCFTNYRHPAYQHDAIFTGCHWVYSSIYTNIRDWLQPSWFIFVQATVTMALCVETIALVAISIIFMHFLIQYQMIVLSLAFLCHAFTAMLLSFAVVTFYLKAFDKSWIMYPEFNHVDWSFMFAVLSTLANGIVSYLYYQEVKTLKDRLLKMKRLVVATSNNRSIGGGDVDSIDAVYAARSGSIENEYHGNRQSQYGNKDPASLYPQFTQV